MSGTCSVCGFEVVLIVGVVPARSVRVRVGVVTHAHVHRLDGLLVMLVVVHVNAVVVRTRSRGQVVVREGAASGQRRART